MKFLVIGASGFIGSHLMDELQRSGHEAIGTASRSGIRGQLKFNLLSDTLSSAIPRSFFESKEPPVLVLAAVQGNMDRCLADPETSHLVNAIKPIELLREASTLGCRIIFLSTGHVFDGSVGNRSETDPPNPVNQYARQKFEVEEFLRNEYPDAIIARMDKVIGEDLRHLHLLSEWWSLARMGQPLLCVKGMEISPTSVIDIAQGLIRAAERGLCGTYHLAGPDCMTRAELAAMFCTAAAIDPEIIEKPLDEFGFLDRRALKSSLNGDKFCNATRFSFSPTGQILERFCAAARQAAPLPTDH